VPAKAFHVAQPPSAGIAANAVDHPRNVILIGWDGAQRDHVNQCLADKQLPNLQRLIGRGVYVNIDIEGVTDTKAGWTQILTGYLPDITGVFSDTVYQPVPKGLSIFERLEDHFGSDAFVTVAVIGKQRDVGEIEPPQGPLMPGSPDYNMYTALEVWEYGLIEDEKVGTRKLELLRQYKDKPFFFFVHFAEVDAAGHQFGENSQQYTNALISSDVWTGRIIEEVNTVGLADQTQFYVTADHGFDEGGNRHVNAPYVFLATNNKAVQRAGRRQDIAPTILEAFGLDLTSLQPPLDGISLTQPDPRPPIKLPMPAKERIGQNRASIPKR
jgi:predicted AlkP superfamily pyrophosphatase or phosphodiesterase